MYCSEGAVLISPYPNPIQWSFGVTMWEVVTLAEMPYSEVDNNRSILSYLMVSDERLPQPDGCPDNL